MKGCCAPYAHIHCCHLRCGTQYEKRHSELTYTRLAFTIAIKYSCVPLSQAFVHPSNWEKHMRQWCDDSWIVFSLLLFSLFHRLLFLIFVWAFCASLLGYKRCGGTRLLTDNNNNISFASVTSATYPLKLCAFLFPALFHSLTLTFAIFPVHGPISRSVSLTIIRSSFIKVIITKNVNIHYSMIWKGWNMQK